MAHYLIKDSSLSDIGDAIREKLGFSDKMSPSIMASYIRDRLGVNLSSIMEKNISYIYDTVLTSIKPYAFYDCNELHTAIFTEVQDIGAYAFAECDILSHFESPKCTAVGDSTFSNCPSLEYFNLGVSYIASTDAVGTATVGKTTLKSAYFSQALSIDQYVFSGCTNLTTISLPIAQHISQYAFQHCYSLKSVYFPEVTTAGHYLFSNCSALERIEMPLCSYFGKFAFQNCTSLKELIVPAWNSSHASGVFDAVGECPIETLAFGFPTAPATFSGKSTLKNVSMSITTSTAVSAFRNCPNLISVYAPQLVRIENRTFTSDYALSTFNFPATTYIGPYAFYECSSILELSSANLPNENLTIGECAFGWCSNLTYVDLPCISMSSYAFSGCTSLERVKMLNLKSTLLDPFKGCIRLSYIEIGMPSIALANTFMSTPGVEYWSLPNLVSVVADRVFQWNTLLESVYTPKLQILSGVGGFESCHKLSDVYMPEVTYVSQAVFKHCSSLSIISLPKCSYVGRECFANDIALKSVYLPMINSHYFSASHSLNLFYSTNNIEYAHLGSIATLQSVLSNKTLLKKVELPGTSSLVAYCFYNCQALNSISMPELVTLSTYAFKSCFALSSFTLPKATLIGANAFENCSSLTEINPNHFPASNVSLRTLAFTNCANLERVVMPTLASVEINPFLSCPKLSYLELGIPSFTISSNCANMTGLKYLSLPDCSYMSGNYTFLNCSSLATASMPEILTISGTGAFEGCSALTSIYAPKASYLGYAAFYRCSGLSKVYLPKVEYIGRIAFGNCTSLTHVDLPACSSYYYSTSSWATRQPFSGCANLQYLHLGNMATMPAMVNGFANLTSVSLPNTTALAAGCFSACVKLSDVYLPKCITVNGSALRNCSSLSKINLPAATTVGTLAFYNDDALTSVSLPALTTLGARAFEHCGALSTFTMPVGVSIIQQSTFLSCTSLMSLYLPRTSTIVTLSNVNALGSTPMSLSTLTGSFGKIYVPSALYASYIAATNWKNYSARFVSM